MSDADQQLLSRLKAGEEKAVTEWYRQYFPQLERLANQKISSPTDAEELVQDVFLSCLKSLPLFRGESGLETWMRRILSHRIADYYRQYYAKKTIHALALDEFVAANYAGDAHEVAHRVTQALQLINQDYRELLLLKYVDRLRVKQIASQWGRSIKSIESDLFRARQAFKLAYNLEQHD